MEDIEIAELPEGVENRKFDMVVVDSVELEFVEEGEDEKK